MDLYGECLSHTHRARVRVSALGATGCDLEADPGCSPGDGESTLWIGAVGPFAVTTVQCDASHASARFHEELDDRILDHFAYG